MSRDGDSILRNVDFVRKDRDLSDIRTGLAKKSCALATPSADPLSQYVYKVCITGQQVNEQSDRDELHPPSRMDEDTGVIMQLRQWIPRRS